MAKETLAKIRQIPADERVIEKDQQVRAAGGQSRLRQFAHFWILVWTSFSRNRGPVRAAALAYGTLLALVPMLAVVFSITTSLLRSQGQERINVMVDKFVDSVIPAVGIITNSPDGSAPMAGSDTGLRRFIRQERVGEARDEVKNWIHKYVQNVHSGTLGLTGMGLLIFVGISMLTRIEAAFNDIWGVTVGRNWFWRIVIYWCVISLAPVLATATFGLAGGAQLDSTKAFLERWPFISSVLFQLLPVFVLMLSFALFYLLMPNTKVQWDAAVIGGLTAGILFHLNSVFSVLYVSRVVTNSKIYGSLGLVPIFMVGLYFAWLILLFGAQVAYAYQNRTVYEQEKQVEQVDQLGREFLALRIMACLGYQFYHGEPPLKVTELATTLGVPSRLVQKILDALSLAQLTVEVSGKEVAFTPARALENITNHDVLTAMRSNKAHELTSRDEPTVRVVTDELNRIRSAEQREAGSMTMLELVKKIPPPSNRGDS